LKENEPGNTRDRPGEAGEGRSLRGAWLGWLAQLVKLLDLKATGRWMVFGLLIGLVGGLGALAFEGGLEFTQKHLLYHPTGFHPARAGDPQAGFGQEENLAVSWWLLLLIPVLGGAVSGFLIFTWAPEAEGHGTDAMVKSFHRLNGMIRRRVVPLKAVASFITIGTGGSAGKEGPIAQIGGGFGSMLADWLKTSRRDRRLMLLAGASAGLGAIFQAPLGAALFAGEVLYKETDMEVDALVPCLISSIVGYWIYMMGLSGMGLPTGEGLFAMPPDPRIMDFTRPWELPIYAVLGVVCALVGLVYIKFFYGSRDRFFHKLSFIPLTMRPAVGGLLLGLLAVFLGDTLGFGGANVLGGGYGVIQLAINGTLPIWVMAVLAFGKILATSFTISSGGSGGVFAPSLVVGALLGGIVGNMAVTLGLAQHAAPFVLVGMGGFFGGVAKVPITSVIMVSEMTKSYGLLAPLMLVCTVSFLLIRRWTLYEEQVPTRLDSQAHRGDFVADFLQELQVGEVMETRNLPPFIRTGTPLRDIMHLVSQDEHETFPVVDGEGRMVGVITLAEVRRVITEQVIWDLVVVEEFLQEQVEPVFPSHDLHTALRRLTRGSVEELPVVAEEEPERVVGMISRKDVIAAYDRMVQSAGQGQWS